MAHQHVDAIGELEVVALLPQGCVALLREQHRPRRRGLTPQERLSSAQGGQQAEEQVALSHLRAPGERGQPAAGDIAAQAHSARAGVSRSAAFKSRKRSVTTTDSLGGDAADACPTSVGFDAHGRRISPTNLKPSLAA